MAISFKSVGKTKEQKVVEALNASKAAIGIKTPLRTGTNELFEMNYSLADQVNDNLRNLLLTNWGERLCLYDFGANLRPLLSDYVSQDDFDSRAVEQISGTVNKWMPYVSLETFESTIDKVESQMSNGLTAVVLNITYSVPVLQVQKRMLSVTMYVM